MPLPDGPPPGPPEPPGGPPPGGPVHFIPIWNFVVMSVDDEVVVLFGAILGMVVV